MFPYLNLSKKGSVPFYRTKETVDPGSTPHLNQITDYEYDNANRLETIQDPVNGSGNLTVYSYTVPDELTTRITVTDPGGRAIVQTFDGAGRLISLDRGWYMVDAEEHHVVELYEHDPAGNMTKKIKADENEIVYHYDARNQLTCREYPDGSLHSFAYDPEGRLVSESGGECGTTSFGHDAAGRVVSVSQPVGDGTKTISYAYDDAGNRVEMVDPEEAVTSYGYDGANRQTSVADSTGATGFVYDGAGRLTRQNNSNGTYMTQLYDTAGRLKKVENRKTSGSVLFSSFTYTLDASGNRTHSAEIFSNGVATFGAEASYVYDGLNRPTSEHWVDDAMEPEEYQFDYVYDPSGNRITATKEVIDSSGDTTTYITYTYDLANRLTQESRDNAYLVTDYTYDDNGNPTLQVKLAGGDEGGRTNYGWDYDDKLVRCWGVDIDTSEEFSLQYRTDAGGFRRMKEVGGENYASWFVYDLVGGSPGVAPLVGVYSASEESVSLTRAYVYGSHGLLHTPTGATTKRWYVQEALGNVRQLTNSSGAVVEYRGVDAWGADPWGTFSTADPFVYMGASGYYQDSETGLYLLGARYYDPNTGRFLSSDPIGLAGGDLNLYRYVKDRPTVSVDPAGLWDSVTIHGAWTRRWAWDAAFLRLKNGCYVTYRYPEAIGDGSEGVDDWYRSAVLPANWPMHFNWRGSSTDWASLRDGGPLAGTPDERLVKFRDHRDFAIRFIKQYGPGECKSAMRVFGAGLHPLQDMYAHGGLTPAEHLDHRNHPDDPTRDVVETGIVKRLADAPKGADWKLAGGIRAIRFLVLMNPSVRILDWPRGSSRFERTRTHTIRELNAFLRKLWEDPATRACTRRVARQPISYPSIGPKEA